jgi:hypothetical protein
VEHLVHLMGKLHHRRVLDGRLEEPDLRRVLELAAPHRGVVDPLALRAHEDDGHVLLGGTDHGGKHVRNARPRRRHDDLGAPCHS